MDILNFISWIKASKLVSKVDPSKTLVPLGVKTDRRDDDYVSVTMTVQDLASNLVIDRLVAGTREVVLTDNAGDAELTFNPGTAVIQTSGVGSDLYIRTLTGDDIILESGDDITIRGDKGDFDQIAEGGDINIFAGDGSDGNTQDAGNGGDIRIEAGGAGSSTSGLQAPGGSIGIRGGYSTLIGTAGGDVAITPGNSVSNQTGFVYISGNNQWGFDTSTGALYFPIVDLSTLPSAGSVLGARAMIFNSSVAASGNFGAIAAAGGSNIVPVFSDGVNWLIG